MQLRKARAWLKGFRALGVGAGILLLVGVFVAWRYGERVYFRLLRESPSRGQCRRELTKEQLERSLALGARYLLAHQKADGSFDYEYDWRSGSLSAEDNEVRQAGALWGMALIHQTQSVPELAAGIERGLSFFDQHSQLVQGSRCVAYPGSTSGTMGTVALVALAYTDYLRSASGMPKEQRAGYEQRLDELLAMLLGSVSPSGLWYSQYDVKTCKPFGKPSSYSDGEALLALTKAAKYLGRRQHVDAILRAAAAGRRLNIQRARAQDADSDITKGYYQWSSMAFHEIATSDFPGGQAYGPVVVELADWIIDEHAILTRYRNTGYAFEGITVAYDLAQRAGDAAHAAKFACAIDIGLQRLLSWQVGGPSPNRFTAGATDPKALGGVQNGAFDSPLRIDVTQHQMHATQLALQYLYR